MHVLSLELIEILIEGGIEGSLIRVIANHDSCRQ
jgi:hypothetical protein